MNEQGSVMQRRLVSHSAFIFAIRAFPAIAQVAVGIAFTRTQPKALNGIYQQLWMYIAILIAVACFGIPPLMLTHNARSVSRWLLSLKSRHLTLFSIWLIFLSLAFIILFHGKAMVNPWILLLLLVAQVWVLLLETYLIISQRFLTPAVLSGLYALFFCAIHYAFLKGCFSFSILLWLVVCLSALRTMLLCFVAGRAFATVTQELRRSNLPGSIRKQWMQLGIYDISQVSFRWIDKLLISGLVGPALFSVYFVGTTDVPFMAMMLSAAGNALLQQMATGEGTHSSRIRLVNFSGTLLARIVFPVFFFLFFFRSEFIEVIFTKDYLTSVPLFAISVLALPLRAYNYTSVLQHLNKVKIINWGAVLDLSIACGLAVPLFFWKGLPGVAFAFMISSYIQAAFYLYKTSREMHCSILQLIPWKQWIVMLIVFGIAAIGLHELLSRYFSLRQSLILGFAGTALVIFMALAPIILRKKSHG